MLAANNLFIALFGLPGVAMASCLRCKDGAWIDLAPIPVAPRQEHATVAVSHSTIAILGGIVPDNGSYSTTDMMQLYDIPTNSWRSASNAPFKVNHPNVAVVNNKIYLLGGLAVAPDGAWKAVPDSWVYNPVRDKWTRLDPIPDGMERGSATMGVHGETIYLAGGMTQLSVISGYQDSIDSVLAFDTCSETWITLPEPATRIPEGRDHAGGAVVGSTYYVIGGRYFGQHNFRDTVFALDLRHPNRGWRTSSGRMPTARGGVSAGTIGRLVYIFGGEGNEAEGSHGVFNETEVFDTLSETWKKLGPMKLPRHGTSAVAVGDRVYIPGGGIVQSAGPVNVTDSFCPFAEGH
ncbi:hypothetical protein AK830_g4657 [Neonectria ditissima]|uniref:Kelch-like protein terF n=1 Tax=Neonectria ditissima TaxID=78410 RepID=A0A0P7BKU1_9HYPO|nr:hypothetical protein AK830_g4657 [Neonectria ditissima]